MAAHRADTGDLFAPTLAGRTRDLADAHASAALRAILDVVVTIDHRGRVLEFNRAAEELFGYRREDILGQDLAELIIPAVSREAHRRGLARWAAGAPAASGGSMLGRRVEVTARNAQGDEFPIELAIARLELPGPPVFTASIRDVGDRKRSEDRVRVAEERFRALVEQLPLVVYVDAIDDESSNIYSSPQVEALLGYSLAEWKQDRELFVRILHPEDRQRVLDAHRRAHEGDGLSLEYRLIARDGRVVWVHDEARTIPGRFGTPVALQGYLLDVTARREAEERLRHQAYHDHLTGLPNRALFKERVEEALARSGPAGPGVAVLMLDIDDLKAVNDRFGHMDADEVLQDLGSRLRVALPPTVTLARIGGDEFAALVESENPAGDAEKAARAVCEALRAPTQLAGVEIFVTASIGIAIGDDADRLFRQADLAMYRAKASGKAQSVLYDGALDDDVGERISLLGELRSARIDREFVLHYQPVVDLRTVAVVGAEALLRWQHPTRGLVLPGEFVPIAEESGVIVPLGRWVLQEACRRLALWRTVAPAARGLHVRVNVSARQLQAAGFADDVRGALASAALEPQALVLEITEASVVRDPESGARLLDALRSMGVGLVLDGFGTGYSSLAMLDALPFDGLKLDRTSVTRIGASGGAVPLVQAIVDLARALGLSLVTAGIENEHQLAELRRLGVREGQGFLFARPLPADGFERLLRDGLVPPACGQWVAVATDRRPARRARRPAPHGAPAAVRPGP
ncbi:MAG: EAL domain-containing protein [Gaiella sp.]|nr:EAL domain-containing protein [Gaiella sp.]